MSPYVSIIIPTYQHADHVRDAIDSALAQTLPCEVIVIDDGSDDDGQTVKILASYGDQIRWVLTPHRGPCAARNKGIELATGEYLMFLDADDLIDKNKVVTQLAAFDDTVGWVLCDVRIENDTNKSVTTASEQYDYAAKDLGGWIQHHLQIGNFIPIMSPLVRRSVLADVIRFREDRAPEDWHFWHEVSAVARVRYVPKVLATYRHRRTGRSRLPKKARTHSQKYTLPLRLNLGCGTPHTRSWHPIAGMINLDKSIGWTFEDGLGDFVDYSVAGITISHALMYVPEEKWPAVFSEFSRVLMPGGVIRITEDETSDPTSRRLGGWKGSDPAITLTTPALVAEHLTRAGLTVHHVGPRESKFSDGTLMQQQHGQPPDVFFIEGVKLNGVLFSPHADDETLFAAFTILKYRPRVVVCYPSERDYGPTEVREQETREAMSVLGGGPVEQWAGGDLVAQMRAFDARVHPNRVWAPDPNASHPDHVAVANAAIEVFGERCSRYHTYNAQGKVRDGQKIAYEPVWIHQKLRALTRYASQVQHPRACEFFAQDLAEYAPDERR